MVLQPCSGSLYYLTYLFYCFFLPDYSFLQDFDATQMWGVPVEIIGGIETVPIDIDGDGYIDVYLPRRKYEAGTIIDSDIVMNQLFDEWELPPEDPPGGTAYADWLGSPDIEGIMEHEMGHMPGVGHSYLYMATMTGRGHRPRGSAYPTDPWQFRELDLDDKMTLGLNYPNSQFLSSAGISGEVIDGNSPLVTGAGTAGVDGNEFLCRSARQGRRNGTEEFRRGRV